MSIIPRNRLIELFKSNELKIEDLNDEIKTAADREYSIDNPFQQCSIDLSVGSIYVPETKPEEIGGAYNPKTNEHLLKTGQTVMIRTNEKVTLSNRIGGICFSPSRLALKAILITNMGHVDPGYSGHLHFTAINMGKEAYTFRKKDVICSMVFFELDSAVPAYGEEHFKGINTKQGPFQIPAVISNFFPKLAKDFVDVEKRAQTIARKEINKTKIWQIGIPVIVAGLMATASIVQIWVNKPWEKEMQDITHRVSSIEKKVDFEKRITEIEKILSTKQDQKASKNE